jgi:hypothetical protein
VTFALYHCTLVYLTPAGRRVHYHTKTVARDADDALALAERHLANDSRRVVQTIVHRRAIEQ